MWQDFEDSTKKNVKYLAIFYIEYLLKLYFKYSMLLKLITCIFLLFKIWLLGNLKLHL